jgi:hypothetical protein
MLLRQLEYREQMSEHHKRAYTYAPSYEDFIKLINSNSDVDFLKQLRYCTCAWNCNTGKTPAVIRCLARPCESVCVCVCVCVRERERERWGALEIGS